LITRRAEARRHLLDAATTILAETLDYQEALRKLCALAVPHLADWCGVYMAKDEGRRIEQVAMRHLDPMKLSQVLEMERRFPPKPDRTRLWHVIRTGEPVLVRRITEKDFRRIAHGSEHLRWLHTLGIRSILMVPLRARGRIYGCLALANAESGRHFDRTDLDFITDLAYRAGVEIDNARLYGEAQHAIRLRENILAIVSHDLRNPLGAIRMAATALAAQTQCPSRHVEIILRSGGRMERLISDLLDMASIQAGRLAVERETVTCCELVDEAVQFHAPVLKTRGVQLERLPSKETVEVHCDRRRILQVLSNLLANSAKFTGPGGRVEIGAGAQQGFLVFTVSDTGSGIHRDDLSHVFEPYWSGRRPRVPGGTGLGLFISKGIVEAHGGRIWVESNVGRGTTVRFSLPLALPVSAPHRDAGGLSDGGIEGHGPVAGPML
jgi:signal transduction histidine kinase